MADPNTHSSIKNVAIVSSTTVLSRLLGLVREIVFFIAFGVSDVGGTFILAFTLPNMFRKLLGEGALSSALVPVLANVYTQQGRGAMFHLFSCAFKKIFFILIAVSFGLFAGLWGISYCPCLQKWQLFIQFSSLLLPYMTCVCIAAISIAVFTLLGHFFIGAINQIWANITMIIAMILGAFVGHCEGITLAYWLIGGVLVGGLLQLLIPLFFLWKLGWGKLRFPRQLPYSEYLRDIWKLFLPGTLGATIEQLNLFVSRAIAYSFNASIVSVLYLANRITELPIGVFGVAIITVFFPKMAKAIGGHKPTDYIQQQIQQCYFGLLWILVPSAVGLFCVREDVLNLLFQYGKFEAKDATLVLPIIGIYCLTILFSGTSSLFVRLFHAYKDTRTPVKVGAIIFLVNTLGSVILLKMAGLIGLAMANLLSSITQSTLLTLWLRRHTGPFPLFHDHQGYAMILLGGVGIFMLSAVLSHVLPIFSHHFSPKIASCWSLLWTIVCSVGYYLLLSYPYFRRHKIFCRK